MYLFYSLALTLAFVVMSPLFLLRRHKYAAGFRQRLGGYPEFEHDGRKVIWLHCVSVGETNAARTLVDQLRSEFPAYRIVISTTTLTGQKLARGIFADNAEAVFYFPFDWKFSVRKALANYKPSVVLLMETEIWPRFIREAKLLGAKTAIVNGRLSERSFRRYSMVRPFIKRVLADLDLALMQDEDDMRRLIELGISERRIATTGNIKFDLHTDRSEESLTVAFQRRFGLLQNQYLLVAASTHKPEEKLILDVYDNVRTHLAARTRLLIAPRHPERFGEVAILLEKQSLSYVLRSEPQMPSDMDADIILLDSIGELRAVYPLASVVFIGGSLIPHGGQSILEPAISGKAIITGPYTRNFTFAVNEFLSHKALIQIEQEDDDAKYVESLTKLIIRLLEDPVERGLFGQNARKVMEENRGATAMTIERLKPLLVRSERCGK